MPDATVIVIEPRRRLAVGYLRELWRFRELLFFLTWRDVKVRYKQTLLGALWAILQPLATAFVFTLFFGKIAGIRSDGVPYPLFSYAGLLMWTFFAQSVSLSAASLVSSAELLRKVFFPRLLVPLAAVLGSVVDLLVASPVLIGFMVYYHTPPAATVLFAPLFVLLAVVTAVGVGLWLSALNVEYRDVRYVVPFLIQLWLFITPVIYPVSMIAPRLESLGIPVWILGLNPMGGVVEGLRWSVLGLETSRADLVAASFVVAIGLLVTGAFYFRSVERSFADVV